MVITAVCLPHVHCSLPLSTGLCCPNVHCSSPVVVFHCCSSLLSTVSLSSCCQHLETDMPQFCQCLLFDTALFLSMPQLDNACFWHIPVFANTQFHTNPDFYQYLIIAGTYFLPIPDSIWTPDVANTLYWVKGFGFLVSIRQFMLISTGV